MDGVALQKFGEWNHRISQLARMNSTADIPAALCDAVSAMIECDMYTLFLFSAERPPENLHIWEAPHWPAEDIHNYLRGAYLLDPFYRAGLEGIPDGLYRLFDIAPPAFRECEYYKVYCGNSPLEDEAGFIIYLEDGIFAELSICRSNQLPAFSEQEIELLRCCTPAVKSALERYWQGNRNSWQDTASELYLQLESAMSVFGNSVLTPREAEIMRLYLSGHDTNSIAKKLGISVHTVCAHRKNGYARLDINCQAELFSLFISSMYCFQGETDIDPLIKYLNAPGQALDQTECA